MYDISLPKDAWVTPLLSVMTTPAEITSWAQKSRFAGPPVFCRTSSAAGRQLYFMNGSKPYHQDGPNLAVIGGSPPGFRPECMAPAGNILQMSW